MGCCTSSAAVGAPAQAPPGEQKAEASSGTTEITAENAKEVSMEAFTQCCRALVQIAVNGYPRAVRSTHAKRNELLRKHIGDVEQAVAAVMDMGSSFMEEAKQFVMGLVPGVGLPAALVYPLWKQLRKICLIAGIYGHDLHSEEVQAKILYAFAGSKAGAKAADKGVEMAAQALWKAMAGPVARFIPVGKAVSSLADMEGKAMQLVLEEFKEGGTPVTAPEYMLDLDPEPTLQDFAQLLKETGVQSVDQAVRKGTELASSQQAQELRAQAEGAARAAAGQAMDGASKLAGRAAGFVQQATAAAPKAKAG